VIEFGEGLETVSRGRRLLIPCAAIALAAALLPASVRADDPTELTPDGPATLMNVYSGPVLAYGNLYASVLVAVRVQVGPGGRGGSVRVRVHTTGWSDPRPVPAQTAVGDPVDLPAEPGTYTFPAPHVSWDVRDASLGIDQTTGGHAIVSRQACRPDLGRAGDPCQVDATNVFAGDPPPGSDGTPSATIAGAQLTITGIAEIDKDADLLGDATEDRTDLKITSAPLGPTSPGWAGWAVTITNAGPLQADLPSLATSFPGGTDAHWDQGCQPDDLPYVHSPDRRVCPLAALAPGASRTLTLIAHPQDAGLTEVSAQAEGPDLNPVDNTARLTLPQTAPAPRPALWLGSTARQYLSRGIRLAVSATTNGRRHVRVAFKLHGHALRLDRSLILHADVPRTLIVHVRGAKLRSLRRALRSGPLPGQATVTGGGGTQTAKFSLRTRP
jgi:hypothetical protein